MINNRVSLYVAIFLIIGFFFLALPQDGYTQDIESGCCQELQQGGCATLVDPIAISQCEDGFFSVFIPGQVCDKQAGECVVPPSANIPTLSEWGLLAMAGILGIVGFMVIRRRKVTA